MLPLKKNTVWKKEVTDKAENLLVVRIEKEQLLCPDPQDDKITHTLEIRSPSEDRRGHTVKKRMRVTVDRALFQEIKEVIIALRQLQSNPRRRQIHFIEHRCECSGRFVITLEELPFVDASRAEFRYVIGNEKDIRFVSAASTIWRSSVGI